MFKNLVVHDGIVHKGKTYDLSGREINRQSTIRHSRLIIKDGKKTRP